MKTLIRTLLVKRAGFVILLCLVSGLSFSQRLTGYSPGYSEIPQDKSQIESGDEKWASFSLSLNAGCFLVTGPFVQADFRIAKKTYLGVYYVYHHLGLFSGELIFDRDLTSFSPKSMGAGIYAKQYFGKKEQQHPWYCGIYLGYSYNEGTYHSGYPNERLERVHDLLFFGSGGRRWNIGKHFYVLTGLDLGFAYAADDKLYSVYNLNSDTGLFIKEESFYRDYSGEFYFYPLPDLTIGISF